MDLAIIRSIFTVVLFAVFIGIVLWAWTAKRKARFDAAAQLPFADDRAAIPSDHVKEPRP